jgi:two-component sensor histidine kinase
MTIRVAIVDDQALMRDGFGMILIRRSLAKTIASTVEHEFRPEGVVATISLPLQPTDPS